MKRTERNRDNLVIHNSIAFVIIPNFNTVYGNLIKTILCECVLFFGLLLTVVSNLPGKLQ